jgi:hypothetical protein
MRFPLILKYYSEIAETFRYFKVIFICRFYLNLMTPPAGVGPQRGSKNAAPERKTLSGKHHVIPNRGSWCFFF